MARRRLAATSVVGHDRRQAAAGRRRVDEDRRQGSVRQPLALARPDRARRHDQPVDPALDQQVEVRRLALRVLVGVAEEDRVALADRGVLDGLDELREVRVLDVGDDQSEGEGRAALERAGDVGRPEAEVARGRLDAGVRRRARPPDAGQDPADGGGRHAGPAGDVGDGGRHRRVRVPADRPRAGRRPDRRPAARSGAPPRPPRDGRASRGRPGAPRARSRRPSGREAARR